MKKLKLIAKFDKEDIGTRMGTTAPFDYLESMVRFSLSKCVTKKDFCISNVAKSKSLLERLYRELGCFELLTWRQIGMMPREKGISIEKKKDEMQSVLNSEMPEATTFGHFRVDSPEKPKFRIFGALKKDLFYIIYFDIDGKLQH